MNFKFHSNFTQKGKDFILLKNLQENCSIKLVRKKIELILLIFIGNISIKGNSILSTQQISHSVKQFKLLLSKHNCNYVSLVDFHRNWQNL